MSQTQTQEAQAQGPQTAKAQVCETKDKSAQASQKLCDILNYGALNAAMGIGYASGAFEALADFDTPATVAEIAAVSGLDARYLREWLGVMLCGDIVAVEKSEEANDGLGTADRYFLPREYVPLLTKRGGNSNMGVYTQEIPLLSRCALHEVESGMRSGGGIPYSNYPRFYSFMEELADAKHMQTLVDIFLPSVDGGRIISRLRDGIHVCDVGCAEGLAITLMAEAFPKSTFTGIDIDAKCIARARKCCESKKLTNLRFAVQDAAAPSAGCEKYDYITAFDSIHDQTKPQETLRNIHAWLRPGGCFSMIDITAHSAPADNASHPMGAFLYTVSLMHCMPVGLVGGGAGYGMMWGEKRATSALHEAGFTDVRIEDIPNDSFNTHYLCKKA